MENESNPANLHVELEKMSGKGILISGGTTGIGRATALLLASAGAKIFIFGRHEKELQDALRDLKKAGSPVSGTVADQAKPEDIQRVFREAEKFLGNIDILINNAAVGAPKMKEITYKEMEYAIRDNLLGYVTCSREALLRMKGRGKGHILFIGSMSAEEKSGSPVYVATKSGIRGFAEALRKEVNKDGIKVTLIEPGSVGTDMPEKTPQEQRKLEKEDKMLKAEDIASCVYYCLTQPERCDVIAIKIRPHLQVI